MRFFLWVDCKPFFFFFGLGMGFVVVLVSLVVGSDGAGGMWG